MLDAPSLASPLLLSTPLLCSWSSLRLLTTKTRLTCEQRPAESSSKSRPIWQFYAAHKKFAFLSWSNRCAHTHAKRETNEVELEAGMTVWSEELSDRSYCSRLESSSENCSSDVSPIAISPSSASTKRSSKSFVDFYPKQIEWTPTENFKMTMDFSPCA